MAKPINSLDLHLSDDPILEKKGIQGVPTQGFIGYPQDIISSLT